MQHILVVDDNKLNLALANDALRDHYKVSTVLSGLEALDFIKEQSVDLILLDIEMPQLDGMETLLCMKQDDMIRNIPVIFLTALSNPDIEAKCLTLGAQDFITKPFFQPAMLQRVQRVLELNTLRNDLEKQVLEKTQELEMLTIQTIATFANAIDAKDPYTKGHSYRVAQYSRMIATKLGWSELALKNLFYTALLHDIGKIGIPDYILAKSASLTQEEFNTIRKHPEIGCHILEDVILVPYLGIGALSHHEKMDGSGYPYGKKENNIPLIGRIISVADAVDAMMSDRAYREKLDVSQVITELQNHSGTQFDPTIADIMISILRTNPSLESEENKTHIQNELLSKIVNEYVSFSNIDGLTGLWNRVYLEEHILKHATDSEAIGALFMIDLDNFKQINDVWGHTAGDALLTSVAVTIQSVIPPNAIACRMGGDEFAIYIPSITKQEASDYAQKVMNDIHTYMRKSNSPFQVTMSIGIALLPTDGQDYQTLYLSADKAMYYAKQTSKNRYAFCCDITAESLATNPADCVLNLKKLKGLLDEQTPQKGAYLVHQSEFKKIYQLMQRMAKRSNANQQIILFTFSHKDKTPPLESELSNHIKNLITAIKESLRLGDVATKFGTSQYIVLLKDAEPDIAEQVAKRIMNYYSKFTFDFSIDLFYETEQVGDA